MGGVLPYRPHRWPKTPAGRRTTATVNASTATRRFTKLPLSPTGPARAHQPECSEPPSRDGISPSLYGLNPGSVTLYRGFSPSLALTEKQGRPDHRVPSKILRRFWTRVPRCGTPPRDEPLAGPDVFRGHAAGPGSTRPHVDHGAAGFGPLRSCSFGRRTAVVGYRGGRKHTCPGSLRRLPVSSGPSRGSGSAPGACQPRCHVR